MKINKICNSCVNYAVQYDFCGVLGIRVGKTIVDCCKDYRPK